MLTKSQGYRGNRGYSWGYRGGTGATRGSRWVQRDPVTYRGYIQGVYRGYRLSEGTGGTGYRGYKRGYRGYRGTEGT